MIDLHSAVFILKVIIRGFSSAHTYTSSTSAAVEASIEAYQFVVGLLKNID